MKPRFLPALALAASLPLGAAVIGINPPAPWRAAHPAP